jgi:hypothetical protein
VDEDVLPVEEPLPPEEPPLLEVLLPVEVPLLPDEALVPPPPDEKPHPVAGVLPQAQTIDSVAHAIKQTVLLLIPVAHRRIAMVPFDRLWSRHCRRSQGTSSLQLVIHHIACPYCDGGVASRHPNERQTRRLEPVRPGPAMTTRARRWSVLVAIGLGIGLARCSSAPMPTADEVGQVSAEITTVLAGVSAFASPLPEVAR